MIGAICREAVVECRIKSDGSYLCYTNPSGRADAFYFANLFDDKLAIEWGDKVTVVRVISPETAIVINSHVPFRLQLEAELLRVAADNYLADITDSMDSGPQEEWPGELQWFREWYSNLARDWKNVEVSKKAETAT